MSRPTHFSLAAVLSVVFFSAAISRGGLAPLDASVNVNQTAGSATFTIDFSHPPDFYTVDAGNRPADAFSIQIAANPTGSNPLAFNNLTTIVSGTEIRFNNNIPVRNAFPASNDKAAGGWGSVRGSVPFTVTGDTLTFTAPLQLLNASSGKFAYQAFTTHYGAETASKSSSTAVPLPPAFVPAMVMLLIGMLLSLCRPMIQARRG
ncbi:MAG TPA: hypothetical protein VFE47_15435 [Tepidisphaeraceae bacterium]|jgi:hypothetical protein|nr:hypothetical protein [Tepidisphaeraceae bacterium]